MLRYTIFIMAIMVWHLSWGQSGIGTRNPHPSAIMELNVSGLPATGKKGLLLNRVALTATNDVTTVPNPVEGLMVFNTNSTTGTYAVAANNVYIWNETLNLWERYFSRNEISSFITPPNYFIQATANQGTASLGTTEVPLTWAIADEVVVNSDKVTLDANNVSFTIHSKGIYDLTGFFNYRANIAVADQSSTTSTTANNQTDVVFQLQRSTNGGSTWVTINGVTHAIGRGVGNTFTSVPIPPTTVAFNENDKFRFVVSRNATGGWRVGHGTQAGLESPTGEITKSLRVSFIVETE